MILLRKQCSPLGPRDGLSDGKVSLDLTQRPLPLGTHPGCWAVLSARHCGEVPPREWVGALQKVSRWTELLPPCGAQIPHLAPPWCRTGGGRVSPAGLPQGQCGPPRSDPGPPRLLQDPEGSTACPSMAPRSLNVRSPTPRGCPLCPEEGLFAGGAVGRDAEGACGGQGEREGDAGGRRGPRGPRGWGRGQVLRGQGGGGASGWLEAGTRAVGEGR